MKVQDSLASSRIRRNKRRMKAAEVRSDKDHVICEDAAVAKRMAPVGTKLARTRGSVPAFIVGGAVGSEEARVDRGNFVDHHVDAVITVREKSKHRVIPFGTVASNVDKEVIIHRISCDRGGTQISEVLSGELSRVLQVGQHR